MAIKERLLKQLQIVRDGLNAMPPFLSRDLNAMRSALVQARDLCFQGLSAKDFTHYRDTYEGLLLAIDQLSKGATDAEDIISLCSELLKHTISRTQKETSFKKEIVFLPYKVSMWDSLESVWKVADEDKEHCIAYVMPIPYADLTSKHTVAEWHCEREMFPKDVPVLDWQSINLEEMHPDVIFIHNPYDEYNRVTSTESRYYSSVLKKQTDKLVYIPYFVLGEVQPWNEEAEESIEHFIVTPAVLNADLTIVQSEKMRQVYINVLERKTDHDRYYWETKIRGFGSPKMDKVHSSKREDFVLPDTWQKLIGNRKIILYNTGLSVLLQNREDYIAKLKDIFATFQESEDVVLWWRPHPLLEATFDSMVQEEAERYRALRQKYIEEGWGIYDDTGDLHRAISWSDAYYGDESSVVKLYEETAKPILIQNIGQRTKDSAYDAMINRISFIDIAVNGNRSWFFNLEYNALFEFDLENGNISLRKIFNMDGIVSSDSHAAIALWDHFLIIAPRNDYRIIKYDINNDKVEYIALDFLPDLEKTEFLFNFVEIYNDCAYLIPGRYPGIIKVNLINNEITQINEWYVKLQFSWKKEECMIFHTCKPLGDFKILLSCWRANLLFIFDLRNETMEYMKVETEGKGICDAIYDENILWASYRNNSSIYWVSGNSKKQYTTKKYGTRFEGGFKFFHWKDCLYAIPEYGSHILKFNKEQDCWDCTEELLLSPLEETSGYVRYWLNFLCAKAINARYAVLYSVFDKQIWWIDWEKFYIKKFDIHLNIKDSKNLFHHVMSLVYQKVQNENATISLSDLLIYIKSRKKEKNRNLLDLPTCGDLIYQSLQRGRKA